MVQVGPRLNSAEILGLDDMASALTLGTSCIAQPPNPMSWICGLWIRAAVDISTSTAQMTYEGASSSYPAAKLVERRH